MRYTLTLEFETWKQLTTFIEATKSSGNKDVKLPGWTKLYETSPAEHSHVIPVPEKRVSVKDGTSAEFVFNVLAVELAKYPENKMTTQQLWRALRSAKFQYGRSWMNQILKEFDKKGIIYLEKIGVGGHGRHNTIHGLPITKKAV